MKKPLLVWAITLLSAPCFAPYARAQGAVPAMPPRRAIALTHVAVINVNNGSVQPDMTVVVDGDRITDVGKFGQVTIPARIQVVAAAGKFLIPGLWDMHVHTFFESSVPGRSVTLPLLIANGITGVRDMGSQLDSVLSARADIAAGTLPGPRMVVAGPMLDGPKTQFGSSIAITTPDDARRAVDMLKSRGVDFIKVQSYLPHDAWVAAVDESNKQHLTIVGHVPDAVRGSDASNAGQKSFEHLIGIFEASSTAEDQMLKRPKSPGRFLDTYDAAKEAVIIKLLAKNQTWQCPTLFWERGQWLVDTVSVSKDPDAKYAPVRWRVNGWPRTTASILKSMDTDPLPVRTKFVQHELDMVKKLHDAGVPFLAGTDTPAGVDVLPGFSLHLELQRFVDAGFSPLEALQTATINPARFFDRLKDMGTVEQGKIADLVLLDANPLTAIQNTRKIYAVIAAGRYYSRAELDRILAQVEATARSIR